MYSQLVRHFFNRFLDNDLIAAHGDMRATFSQALALLAVPGLLIPLVLLVKYTEPYPSSYARDVASWPDKLLFVTFAMIAMGILTVLEWDALFPDRRDYSVLVPLPLGTRTIFNAKLVALMAFLAVFSASINLIGSVMFPICLLAAEKGSLLYFARYVGSHAAATFGAAALVFLFFVAVQGVLLSVLSHRWFRRLSLYVQFAALFTLVLAFLLIPDLMSRVSLWKRQNNPMLYLLPPFWFLGLYQTLAGWGDPVFRALAAVAVKALGGVAAASLAVYILAYQRHVRRSLESLSGLGGGRRRFVALFAGLTDRALLRHPVERACFHFVLKTLFRSRSHRLILAVYVGVGFAFVIEGLVALFSHAGQGIAGRPTPALLSIQLVLSFFVVSGMRLVFAIPAELDANWALRAADSGCLKECLSGVRKATLALAVLPLLAAFLPLHALLWGWRMSLVHSVFGALMAGLLIEVLLLNFRKLPFTCSYLPGKANVKTLWPVYWYAFTLYAYGTARIEYALLERPAGLALFFAVVLVCWGALVVLRRRLLENGLSLIYEELPEPVVCVLNLGR